MINHTCRFFQYFTEQRFTEEKCARLQNMAENAILRPHILEHVKFS